MPFVKVAKPAFSSLKTNLKMLTTRCSRRQTVACSGMAGSGCRAPGSAAAPQLQPVGMTCGIIKFARKKPLPERYRERSGSMQTTLHPRRHAKPHLAVLRGECHAVRLQLQLETDRPETGVRKVRRSDEADEADGTGRVARQGATTGVVTHGSAFRRFQCESCGGYGRSSSRAMA